MKSRSWKCRNETTCPLSGHGNFSPSAGSHSSATVHGQRRPRRMRSFSHLRSHSERFHNSIRREDREGWGHNNGRCGGKGLKV